MNERTAQAPSDAEFYTRALKTMWTQVLALSVTATVWTMSLLALELSKFGRGTPVLPIALMVRELCVWGW